MKRVALKIAYLGTEFYGFQRQPGLSTVEGEILKALEEVGVIEDVDKCGFGIAGRTDRGVHAMGNVISFLTKERVIINQINDTLPQNIRIIAQARVPLRFKARYPHQRHYRYLLFDKPGLTTKYDFHKIVEASKLFKGTHDFHNFSKRSDRNPIRTIDNIKIKQEKESIQIDVFGESFLWNMVRKIVSVLLMVGEGEIAVHDIREYLDSEKEFAIRPMPPEGLILMDVEYSEIKFTKDPYAQKTFEKYLKKEYLEKQTIALSLKEMLKSLK